MHTPRYFKFQPLENHVFYMVGTDPEAMRKTANTLDATSGQGTELSYPEMANVVADDQLARAKLDRGTEAAQQGCTDWCLFL